MDDWDKPVIYFSVAKCAHRGHPKVLQWVVEGAEDCRPSLHRWRETAQPWKGLGRKPRRLLVEVLQRF